ncbi:unnamed protein product, partial [Phaeothamnion confervicola]
GYGRPPSVLPGLRPVCEAGMRAVFCRLDAAGAGAVDAGRLVVVLRADRGVDGLMTRAIGRQRWLAALDKMDSRLRSPAAAMTGNNGSNRGERGSSSGGSRHAAGRDITWGEFLLFFVPTVACAVSADDYASFAGVAGSGGALLPDDVAMLQMVLPSGWGEYGDDDDAAGAGSGESGGGGGGSSKPLFPPLSALSYEQLQREVRRLARERSFLMQRWRDDGDDAATRAAAVHELYRRELAALRGSEAAVRERLAAAAAERDAAAEEAAAARERSAAAEVAAAEARESEQERARAAETAAEASASAAAAAARADEACWRERLGKLEAEHALLRRAHGKAVVTQRALERELARLQERAGQEVEEE